MTRVLLPQVYGNATVAGQGDSNEAAQAFAEAWMTLLGPRAALMVADARLAQCAAEHADYLASRTDTTPSLHLGAGGSHSNGRVMAAGYKLPDYYEPNSNNVESCTRSWEADIAGIAKRLTEHEPHRSHLMGLNWFSGHTVYGCGAAWEPSGSTYFVAIAAPLEQSV